MNFKVFLMHFQVATYTQLILPDLYLKSWTNHPQNFIHWNKNEQGFGWASSTHIQRYPQEVGGCLWRQKALQSVFYLWTSIKNTSLCIKPLGTRLPMPKKKTLKHVFIQWGWKTSHGKVLGAVPETLHSMLTLCSRCATEEEEHF